MTQAQDRRETIDAMVAYRLWDELDATRAKLARQAAAMEGLIDALAECSEYFDTRADVDDGPDGQPIPNTAMRMQSLCESALNAARKAKP